MINPLEDSDDYNDLLAACPPEVKTFEVPLTLSGLRLDVVLAKLMPDYSRSRLTLWIKNGAVLVDDSLPEPRLKILGHEKIVITIPDDAHTHFEAEDIPLSILYEDDTILVVNKPAGLVVHPAVGNWTGTLLNGLLHHCPDLATLPRAGIVHRLDKDTSGLMVVAKTLPAQTHLVEQLQARTVSRIYRAVANGIVPFDGKIETQIGRNPHNRLKMAVVHFGGKPAITHVRVLDRFESHSYIECKLETGRTHQIRVHMAEAGHSLLGDQTYGNPRHPVSNELRPIVQAFTRQALHAYKLALIHPKTGVRMAWQCRLPDDMKSLLSTLRGEDAFNEAWLEEDEDDDWNEDDYDVEVQYVR